MSNYENKSRFGIMPSKVLKDNPVKVDELRKRNNPNNEPTGNWTGRCPHCGSNNLWDDNLAFGCNGCGALLGTN